MSVLGRDEDDRSFSLAAGVGKFEAFFFLLLLAEFVLAKDSGFSGAERKLEAVEVHAVSLLPFQVAETMERSLQGCGGLMTIWLISSFSL